VTTEPSAEEQKDIDERSVATPETADAANSSASDVAQKAQETVQDAASSSGLQSAANNVREGAQQAAQTVTGAFQSATGSAFGSSSKAGSGNRTGSFGQSSPTKILYVGNLYFEVAAPQLEKEFSKFGNVVNCQIAQDSRGLSRGYVHDGRNYCHTL